MASNLENQSSSEVKQIMRVGPVVIEADTTAGAAYVKKLTHPPTIIPAGYIGTPDNSAANVITVEVKGESNHPPIITLPTSATTTSTINPSSMLFVQTSGLYASTYVFHLVNSNEWVQPQNQNVVVGSYPNIRQVATTSANCSGYNFNQFTTDISQFRTVYGSNTYYLNATDFNNQGTVTTANFRPNLNTFDTLSFLDYANSLNNSARTSLLDAVNKSLKSQSSVDGFVMVGSKKVPASNFDKFEDIPAAFVFQVWTPSNNSSSALLPNSATMYFSVGALPHTASDLLTLSSKSATRPAKDGAFVVQQNMGPISEWQTSPPTNDTNNVFPYSLTISLMRCHNTGSATTFVPLYSQEATSNLTSPFTGETKWNNLDWSYTLFEGLTIPSVTGTTLSSVPYITVKTFKGFEASPMMGSNLLAFQHSLPLPDPKAIQMVVGIMHARPDSLPASANDLGTIAATALQFLPKAVDWLKDLFGNKENKAKAMAKATDFVKGKPKAKPTKQPKTAAVAKVVKKEDNKLGQQIAKLTKQVASMASKPPSSTLPSYTSSDLSKKRPRSKK